LDVSITVDPLNGDTLMKWSPINYTYKKVPAVFSIPNPFEPATLRIVGDDFSPKKSRGGKYNELLFYDKKLFRINGSKQKR
jgi:hypothetical protein